VSLLLAAVWAELLKARRSRLPLLAALGFSLAPMMAGLFMLILKNPARARSLGLLRAKAQLAGGVADWPTYFGLLAQATAVGGALLFAVVTAWVFGREFAERTAKELLAVPAGRDAVVAAKFVVVVAIVVALTATLFAVGLGVGAAVEMPGWSPRRALRAARMVGATAALTLALMPPVALLASAGRGYLAPLGWAILTLFLAQVVAATGWGSWFPWSVPALFSGLAGPEGARVGRHGLALVAATGALGLAGTFAWWRRADQPG
jgi:ABC-2 type transport system permease protein